MTRHEFITRLRAGLAGLPPQALADLSADYENHVSEGAAAGRSSLASQTQAWRSFAGAVQSIVGEA